MKFFKHFNKFLRLTSLIFVLFFMSSCLEQNKDVKTPAVQSAFSPSSFYGVKSATNKGGPILLAWDAPNVSIKGFNVYRGLSALTMSLIGKALPGDTTYLDGKTTAGQVYVYKVKAVDANNLEDSNNTLAFGISYAGLYQAYAAGKTAITVGLPYVIGAIDNIYIYAQPLSGGVQKKFGPYPPNSTLVTVSGLRSGVSYKVWAQAYVLDLDTYDGNTNTITTKTDSFSFTGNTVSDYAYRGFINVKSYGNAPGAPVDIYDSSHTIPNSRLISLKSLAFNGYNTSHYKFVRIEESIGRVPDVNATADCSSGTLTSCVPVGCSSVVPVSYQGTYSASCDDTSLAAPPAKYHYAVTLIKSDTDGSWVEELPDDNPESVTIKVQVAPDNMVLAHRDAANYEMCFNMSRVSDPKFHQRCIYSGLGATTQDKGPGTSTLNLDPNYYDIGYSLFVDRWEAACNWTPQSNGGMCGPGATPGNCIGYLTPAPNVGADGNVYAVLSYNHNNSQAPGVSAYYPRCVIKKNGAWTRAANINYGLYSTATGDANSPLPALTLKPYQSDPNMMTSDPLAQGGSRVPMQNVDSELGQGLCQGQVDSNYGKKRLPRSREFRVFAADEWLPGETNTTLATLKNINNANNAANVGHKVGNWACNEDLAGRSMNTANVGFPNWNGVTPTDFPSSLSAMLDPTQNPTGIGNYTDHVTAANNADMSSSAMYFIGSLGTSHCVSRFGVQDAVGNSSELASDQYVYLPSGGSSYLTGFVNSYDPTNLDVVGFQFNVTGIDTGITNTTTCCNGAPSSAFSSTTAYVNVIAPLGLMTKTFVNGGVLNSDFRAMLGANNSARFYITGYTAATNFKQYNGGHSGFTAGRWSTLINSQTDYGFRCVLPADE